MNFPTFLNKWVIGFKPIKYRPFWWWYRLMCHEGFRFDDYGIWKEFWHSLNHGWQHMEYVYHFEEYWGEGSYPPERIVVSEEAYDDLMERIIAPPDPEVQESIRKILNRKAPWDEDYEQPTT
jgi:hypothetical protein